MFYILLHRYYIFLLHFRPPFSGLPIYQDLRTELLSHGLNIATSAQRDRFAERPVDEIRQHCKDLADLADKVIQEYSDPLILQPASLDLATVKKRAGDDLVSCCNIGGWMVVLDSCMILQFADTFKLIL